MREAASCPRPAATLRRGLCVLLALLSTGAGAETAVSGSISADTTWTTQNAPYRLSGVVSIDSGARLTINPGVKLLMEADASLVVQQGALIANGSPENRIVITSVRDQAGQTPAAGDWGKLEFRAGTLDGQTVLRSVTVSYGNGIYLTQASPRLDFLSIDHHNSAAISMDLESQPLGQGLAASANTVNGIVLRGNVVAGTGRFGLRGIPYVVEQSLQVGAAQFSYEPVDFSPAVGTTRNLTLRRVNPNSSAEQLPLYNPNPDILSLPATISFGSQQSTVQIPVTGISEGSSIVTLTQPGVDALRIPIQVRATPDIELSPSPLYVPLNNDTSLRVSLASPAPAGGQVINLAGVRTGSAGSVPFNLPATVTVPAKSSSVDATIQGLSTATGQITASAAGLASAAVNVNVLQFRFVDPTERQLIVRGGERVLEAVINVPAPVGGLAITLSTNFSSRIETPASITIAEGETSAPFTVRGLNRGSATITLTAPGFASGLIDTYVDNYNPQIGRVSSFAFSELIAPHQSPAAYRIDMGAFVPSGATARFTLSIEDPALATLSTTSISVVGNQSGSGYFYIRGLESTGTTQLHLSAPGFANQTYTLRATEVPHLEFAQATQIIGNGLVLNGGFNSLQLRLEDRPFAAPQQVTLSLQSADPGKVEVPATTTLNFGSSYASVELRGKALTAGSPVTISAVDNGGTPLYPTAATQQVNVVAPQLQIHLSTERYVLQERNSLSVDLTVPGSMLGSWQSSEPYSLTLDVVDATPANIVDGIWSDYIDGTQLAGVSQAVPAGQYFYALVGTPTAGGSYRIRAQSPEFGEVTSELVNVIANPLSVVNEFYQPVTEFSLATGDFQTFGFQTVGSYYPYDLQVQCADTNVCLVEFYAGGGNIGLWRIHGVNAGSSSLVVSASNLQQPLNLPVTVAGNSGYPTSFVAPGLGTRLRFISGGDEPAVSCVDPAVCSVVISSQGIQRTAEITGITEGNTEVLVSGGGVVTPRSYPVRVKKAKWVFVQDIPRILEGTVYSGADLLIFDETGNTYPAGELGSVPITISNSNAGAIRFDAPTTYDAANRVNNSPNVDYYIFTDAPGSGSFTLESPALETYQSPVFSYLEKVALAPGLTKSIPLSTIVGNSLAGATVVCVDAKVCAVTPFEGDEDNTFVVSGLAEGSTLVRASGGELTAPVDFPVLVRKVQLNFVPPVPEQLTTTIQLITELNVIDDQGLAHSPGDGDYNLVVDNVNSAAIDVSAYLFDQRHLQLTLATGGFGSSSFRLESPTITTYQSPQIEYAPVQGLAPGFHRQFRLALAEAGVDPELTVQCVNTAICTVQLLARRGSEEIWELAAQGSGSTLLQVTGGKLSAPFEVPVLVKPAELRLENLPEQMYYSDSSTDIYLRMVVVDDTDPESPLDYPAGNGSVDFTVTESNPTAIHLNISHPITIDESNPAVFYISAPGLGEGTFSLTSPITVDYISPLITVVPPPPSRAEAVKSGAAQ